MKSDRYGSHWDKPFLFLAHSGTNGVCCWCLKSPSDEIHHARYRDSRGLIVDREVIGRDVFPVCKSCHSNMNPNGCHGSKHWITGRGNDNRNTDPAVKRLELGYKLLSP
jgi:hypothetical protein